MHTKTWLVAATLAGAALAAQAKDIVDTAVAAGNFKTLVAALKTADLVPTLKGKGPFTVFAPTDEAFAKIPKADLDALLKDKAKLKAVLTYHVVSGKVMSTDLKAGNVKTVQGSDVMVSTKGGGDAEQCQSSGRRCGRRQWRDSCHRHRLDAQINVGRWTTCNAAPTASSQTPDKEDHP